MKRPLVSILVPCRNAAPWLERALQSTREQTSPQVEVIVVDDGSSVGSFAAARRQASASCQVIEQEPRGASAARNRAFASRQGDYIQYLDADDFLAPANIAVQLAAVRVESPAALSFGSVVHLLATDESGPQRRESARSAESNPAAFLCRLWLERRMVQTGQWRVPRGLIEAAGPWDETLNLDDDGEFFTRVALAASGIIPVPDAVAYYRKFSRGGNLSAMGRAMPASKPVG